MADKQLCITRLRTGSQGILWLGNEAIAVLSSRPADILETLIKNKGHWILPERLMRGMSRGSLSVFIYNIRTLFREERIPYCIHTVPGGRNNPGYMLKEQQ